MKYNFDEIINRENSRSVKYDLREELFGSRSVLPLWVADMDFKTPDFVTNALKERLNHPILGYVYRDTSFYSSIIQWMTRRHQWHIQKEWILPAPGIVAGLSLIVNAFTQPGDRIIVQPPVYHPFYHVIQNQERLVAPNPLKIENDNYVMDFDHLELLLKEGAKMLILCSPHNPVGRCWSEEELRQLGNLCVQHDCLIVADEIHSDLIMPGYKHVPLAKLSPDIANYTITCMAPSKTFNLAGLSTSEVIISNPVLQDQYRKLVVDKLHLSSGNLFGDLALEAAYNQGDEWVDELCRYLQGNINYVQDFIREYLPGIGTFRHEATYLLWIDFRKTAISHRELNRKLIFDAGLGLNEGKIFGAEGEGFMRMNAGCPKSTLKEAMHRLKTVF